MAHKSAEWLHHQCRLAGPHCFKVGDKTRGRPQEGTLATSPLPYGGSPRLQSMRHNQHRPTSRRDAHVTAALWGSPTLQSGGHGHQYLTYEPIIDITPAFWGVPKASQLGTESQVAQTYPSRRGGPERFTAGDKISSGPQAGGLATSPLPFVGSPTLLREEQREQ